MMKFLRGAVGLVVALHLMPLAASPAAAQITGSENIRVIQNGATKVVTTADLTAAGVNTLNRSTANTVRWRAALARYFTSGYRPKLLFIGDSKDVGIGAGTASDGTFQSVGAASRNKTAYVAQMLAARGFNVNRQSWAGAAGLSSTAAVNGYDPRRTIPSSWGYGSFSLGGGRLNSANPNTDAMTIVPDAGVITDRVDILAVTSAGLGTISVSDGTTTATQSTNAADGIQRLTFTGFSRGAGKTYSIARTSVNTGSIRIIATIALDSTRPEIEILNAGASGSTTANWNSGANPESPLNAIPAYAPDMSVIQLGTNDMGPSANISVGAFSANLAAIVAAAKTTGDCVVELPTQPPVGAASYQVYPSYIAAARGVAFSAGCIVIDHGARLGSWATASAAGFMFDPLHETASGYADEARPVADALIF
ncbi:hypothetical protein GCM10022253_24160 [Sphingomonas endophytica]|uniref:Lysophospholipase L1-like esterase n=1 Tax=Sphingomonas endophytica TaxID=869719 RepID=A0ABR6N3F6_9SPHN|nr:SGNH/GDSL hydrolase family protein [Sphingomonas endophytica]MBB5725064.1 lysophospholipase L1-like esterase [Sphingomonas endophytica]